jgi:ribonuclease D
LANQPVTRQHKVKPSEAYMLRYESLKNWRKNKANNLGVESDVILPKDLIDIISTKNPNSTDELIIIMHEVPYRFNRYGNEILELLANLGG